MKKIIYVLSMMLIFISSLVASPFNDKLKANEKAALDNGQILIKNIKYDKNMCLKSGISNLGDKLISEIDSLNPKYLAEVIQYKPYKGNEDLPKRLETLLNNVSDYAGIPYYSERHKTYYPLYDSAVITNTKQFSDHKEIYADLDMSPFGLVKEQINIFKSNNSILYISKNLNKLRYHDQFDCVSPEKMKICIFLFKDGDKWVLYGIGGVNAPRIPFFTERIETSFINRIKTFCNFIFKKF